MNFKDEYQKANQHIVPDETFQKQMLSEMKQLETTDGETVKENDKWYQQPFFAVVCFVVLVLIIGGILLWDGIQDTRQQTAKTDSFDVNVGNMTTDEVLKSSEDTETTRPNGGIFSKERWYKEGAKADEIYQSFYQRLRDANGLDAVYQSEDTIFEESERMSSEAVTNLIHKLALGRESKEPYAGDHIVYYMVECKDGIIIKFEVYDDHLLKFSDFSTIYEY